MVKILFKVSFGIVEEEFLFELMADSNLGNRDLDKVVSIKVDTKIDTKINVTKVTLLSWIFIPEEYNHMKLFQQF